MISMYSVSNMEAGNGQTELCISGSVRAGVGVGAHQVLSEVKSTEGELLPGLSWYCNWPRACSHQISSNGNKTSLFRVHNQDDPIRGCNT